MAKELSISALAGMVEGKIVGSFSQDTKITGTCPVEKYTPGRVTFVRNEKFGEPLSQLADAVVLIPERLAELCVKYPKNIYIVVADVANSLMDLQDFFYKDQFVISEEGIASTARIDKSAKIGKHAYIGENVYIGKNTAIGDSTKILHNCCLFDNVTIGNNTYIYPGVCIYKNCQIGNDCLIHSGARIGVDGFRFEQDIEQKTVRKMIHVGGVVVGDRLEIGANTVIDRATFEGEATTISDDVKIDNLVHIAHNARIGARTVIVAQTCIGGSARVGKDVWIGIGAAISDNVTVGDRAKVLLNAVVAYDVPEDEMVSGFYAMPHRRWKQVYKKLKDEI